MGSAPSFEDKKLIDVVQIKTPETENKQNRDFKTSVEQMRFSNRNDIFKQKSDETKMQLNNALQNLKKNQLLSTIEFKKLQKTQTLTTNSQNKRRSTIKHERYEYKSNVNKFSQQNLAIIHKKQNNSKNISSVSSTYIHESKQISQRNDSNTKKTMQAQVMNHLLNRKKTVNSQNSNRQYKNILDHLQVEILQDQKKQEKSKLNQGRKKSKYIKSEKFIPQQFEQNSENDIIEQNFEK